MKWKTDRDVGALLDLGLVLLDAGEDDRAAGCCDCGAICRWCPGQFRARAWTLLALAALERRSGEELMAAWCLDEARRGFLALADEPGLAYLDSHAKPLLRGR